MSKGSKRRPQLVSNELVELRYKLAIYGDRLSEKEKFEITEKIKKLQAVKPIG